jgi:hypothetical protein
VRGGYGLWEWSWEEGQEGQQERELGLAPALVRVQPLAAVQALLQYDALFGLKRVGEKYEVSEGLVVFSTQFLTRPEHNVN